ncbi:MAG TPA: hypothetical protein VK154_13490 [Chitinophagales bacterium]|nr:hypothetical protein [Chitinophagales bacterium]
MRRILKLLVPPIFVYLYRFLVAFIKKHTQRPVVQLPVQKDPEALLIEQEIEKGLILKDKYRDKRVFIVGTGKSIKTQNLLPLKNEVVIGLNEFYLHEQIESICPKYSLFSGFRNHEATMSREVAQKWYTRFESTLRKIGSTALLPAKEYGFIKEINVFQQPDSDVLFINMIHEPKDIEKYKFTSPGEAYTGQSVSVMAICHAIFMGAKEIYLLGLDHDWILTVLENRQDHFYNDSDSEVYKNQEKESKFSLLDDYLYSYVLLFEQYKAIEKFAKAEGIKIINLTPGGLLDIFERGKLEDVLKQEVPSCKN